MAVNLGSTIKDFLEAINTNSEDTRKIVRGEKKIKKLAFGGEDTTQSSNSISTEQNDDDTWSLLLKSEHDINLNVGDQSGISIVDRDVLIYVPEEDASIISIVGGDVDIKGAFGGVSISGGGSSSLSIAKSGGKDHAYLFANDEIRIKATNDNQNGELILTGDKISINGNVDFANANITGLNLGSGTLPIEVGELPTENIDDSKIYVLNEIKNAEVYYFDGSKYCTLSAVILDIVGVTPTINHYVVNELPTNAEITDLQTFSVVNCYIFNNVTYVYGNAGSGNMWLTVSAIFAQMGTPTEDKGRVYDLTNASVEVGLYVYYEEFRKFYLYSNSEWKEIGGSTSDKYVLSLSGNGGTLTDEQYQGLVDNFPNIVIIATKGEQTIVFNTIATQAGAYMAAFSIGNTSLSLAIFPNKNWSFFQENFLSDYVCKTGTNDIGASNTFNSSNIFSETSSVEFKGAVDFTNANVTGLPSGESIDTDDDFTWNGNHTFNGNAQFTGDVDLSNANIIGLPSGGSSSGGGAGLSYKEIYLDDMYSSTSATTATKITGGVCIRAWLPDTVEITDFASVVSALTSLAGGTAISVCAYPAWGYAQISSVNKRIFYVCPTSAGGLNLLGLYPNTNESSNNSMNYLSLGTALRGRVEVTTLIEGGSSSSGGGKTKITTDELDTMLGDYSNHVGKTIQFVYKGSNTNNDWINCLNLVGTATIHNCGMLFKKMSHIASGAASALYYYDYELCFDWNSGDAYIQYTSYDWSNSGGISEDENQYEDITDDNFDIYVIN